MMIEARLYSATGNLLYVIEVPDFTGLQSGVYSKLARDLCEERSADGIMLLDPTLNARVINSDGSDGEFCGNGLRAIAFHLQQTRGLKEAVLTMATHSIYTTVEKEKISMGLRLGEVTVQPCAIEGTTAYQVAVPNPHLVFFNPPPDWRLEQEGRIFCQRYHSNIEWVYPAERGFKVLVYERGVGPTQACGSGAIAVFKVLQKIDQVDTTVFINMPGGSLTVSEQDDRLSVSGEVSFIKKARYAFAS